MQRCYQNKPAEKNLFLTKSSWKRKLKYGLIGYSFWCFYREILETALIQKSHAQVIHVADRYQFNEEVVFAGGHNIYDRKLWKQWKNSEKTVEKTIEVQFLRA